MAKEQEQGHHLKDIPPNPRPPTYNFDVNPFAPSLLP